MNLFNLALNIAELIFYSIVIIYIIRRWNPCYARLREEQKRHRCH